MDCVSTNKEIIMVTKIFLQQNYINIKDVAHYSLVHVVQTCKTFCLPSVNYVYITNANLWGITV